MGACLALSLIAPLSACVGILDPAIPGQEIGQAVTKFLRGQEEQGQAVVDYENLVAGDWTRLLVVCYPATQDDVEEALNFTWDEAPDLRDSNFFAMVVFATEQQVDSYYSVGQNDFAEDLYWTPCPLAGSPQPAVVTTHEANDSRIEYMVRPGEGPVLWSPSD